MFVYTGNFYENMVLRGHMKYNPALDRVEFHQAVIKETTQCESYFFTTCSHLDIDAYTPCAVAMLYVQKDLGTITKAVFDHWDTRKAKLNHQYLYAANTRLTPLDILASVKKGESPLAHVLGSCHSS